MSDIKNILTEGKGISLDFIESADNKSVIARTLVAFANTEGGKLIVGIKDNGNVVGINPADELPQIEEIASTLCSPPIEIVTNTIQDDRHLALEITVPKSKSKHKTKDEEHQLKFYHRINEYSLVGNRIVVQLWKLQEEGKAKPTKLSQDMDDLLELTRVYEPVTVSRLFRLSSINKNDVNASIAGLIYWNYVSCAVVDSAIVYELQK